MKLLSILFLISLLFTACGDNKSSESKTSLDSIDNALEFNEAENDSRTIEEKKDSAVFTTQNWERFEEALITQLPFDMYDAYLPYEKILDSCGLLDTVSGDGYISLLNKLIENNDLMLIGSCNQMLSDDELNNLMQLTAAFTNLINKDNSLAIRIALNNSTERVMRSKNVSPKLIVDEVLTTLGEHNFDKKICQATAILYIMNMVM